MWHEACCDINFKFVIILHEICIIYRLFICIYFWTRWMFFNVFCLCFIAREKKLRTKKYSVKSSLITLKLIIVFLGCNNKTHVILIVRCKGCHDSRPFQPDISRGVPSRLWHTVCHCWDSPREVLDGGWGWVSREARDPDRCWYGWRCTEDADNVVSGFWSGKWQPLYRIKISSISSIFSPS